MTGSIKTGYVMEIDNEFWNVLSVNPGYMVLKHFSNQRTRTILTNVSWKMEMIKNSIDPKNASEMKRLLGQ